MIGLCPLSVNFFFKGHLLQTTGPIVKLLHMNVPHNALYVVYQIKGNHMVANILPIDPSQIMGWGH